MTVQEILLCSLRIPAVAAPTGNVEARDTEVCMNPDLPSCHNLSSDLHSHIDCVGLQDFVHWLASNEGALSSEALGPLLLDIQVLVLPGCAPS